jgi:hypothetical protein
MSKENVERFCLVVLSDQRLQNKLRKITDREEFLTKVVGLGVESGFEFAREDVENSMRENRRLWHERWI